MQTWAEKLNSTKLPQKKRLNKPIAGMPAGAMMYISTPQEINTYIQHIPYGQSVSVQQMRDDLAKQHHADCTCPLTTGIFLRIVAEAAFENMHSTQPVGQPTPFWRVIEPTAPIAKKLSFDPAFIQHMRDAESTANE